MTMPATTVPQPDTADPVREHLLGEGSLLRDLATDTEPEERVLPGHLVRVFLEAGGELEEFTVRVDNRDLVRWDKTAPRHGWNASTHPFIFQTFVGWSASLRAGRHALKFEQFQDAALEVADVKADEARPTR